MMLPVPAASNNTNIGIAAAPRISVPIRPASRSRSGPLTEIVPEWAISPAMLALRPAPIEPAKATSTSVPPVRTNQVLTSWLLATSPFSIASLSFLRDGSSVRSWSCSSAIAGGSPQMFGASSCNTVSIDPRKLAISAPSTVSRMSKPSQIDSGMPTK